MDNFSQFYENIILRDLLEYTAPGIIVLSSFTLVGEVLTHISGQNFSIVSILVNGGGFVWIFAFLLAYIIGHIVTAIHSKYSRKKERSLAANTLENNEWLKNRVGEIVSSELSVSKETVIAWFQDDEIAENIREIGRSIIRKTSPDLYREFVNRHSILSRFFQNTAIALRIFLASLLLSAIMLAPELLLQIKAIMLAPELLLQIKAATLWQIVVFCICILSLIAIIYFSIKSLENRSSRIRRTMAKHTFQIWYSEYLISKKECKNKTSKDA